MQQVNGIHNRDIKQETLSNACLSIMFDVPTDVSVCKNKMFRPGSLIMEFQRVCISKFKKLNMPVLLVFGGIN